MTTVPNVRSVFCVLRGALQSVEDAAWKLDGTVEDWDCLIPEDALEELDRAEMALRCFVQDASDAPSLTRAWELLASLLNSPASDQHLLHTMRAIVGLLDEHEKLTAGA